MRFVPDDWILTPKLRQYARDKHLTDETIDDQEEAFRLCQFPRRILDFDRAWMRWIRNAIKWGEVQPVQTPSYRTIDEVTPEQKAKDLAAYEDQIRRFTSKK